MQAVASITASAGSDLEGILVQPQLAGRREFVAGIFRDPQFGPVVMFGLGGVFTEALSDVSVRLAPLTAADAQDMIDEIRASAMLGPFRGEAPVDRACLVRILLGLSRMAMELPDVLEVDINPLLAGPDGSVRAVDALAVIGCGPPDTPPPPPVEPRAIGALFYPRSIAFVGASSQMGKWGHMLLTNTISGGYEGDVYLVNPRGGTIAGRHVYRSVAEIPDPVDLAVVTIPADRVLELIPEFGRKGIRNMLLITSGFGETGPRGQAAGGRSGGGRPEGRAS